MFDFEEIVTQDQKGNNRKDCKYSKEEFGERQFTECRNCKYLQKKDYHQIFHFYYEKGDKIIKQIVICSLHNYIREFDHEKKCVRWVD